MAGTYLQQDVYGEIAGAAPLFTSGAMNDSQLVSALQAVPAISRASTACEWIVVTAMYQPTRRSLRPPNTTTPECWLAFLDRLDHATPNWTSVPLLIFGSFERNENFIKVMLPTVFTQRTVFLNHALTEHRCFTLSHIIRGQELIKGASPQPHLLASRIPTWSGRSLLPVQLELTRDYAAARNATHDLADLQRLESRMARAEFNASACSLRIMDTLWMIWPTADEKARTVSRLWMHEVARFSSFEKVSYPWVISQVPGFSQWLTDAIYIYAPAQRCG